MKIALSVAGSDPSGGAGIQADLKTFHRFGVYGEAAVTLITVQNTVRVSRVECLTAELVLEQVKAVLEDIPPDAAKTGALGTREIIEAVAELAAGFRFPLVVDPVMISKHGAPLLPLSASEALLSRLLPRAYLLTPNLSEAEALTSEPVRDPAAMREAARRLADLGAANVLVKGGHLEGAALDILLCSGDWFEFVSPRLNTPHTHGTGCTYSAAITAGLACGMDLPSAVDQAKRFIDRAIGSAPGFGSGCGPLNHFA